MTTDARKDLEDQANELGLEFSPSIADTKLETLIREELAKSDPPPAAKKEEDEDDTKETKKAKVKPNAPTSQYAKQRRAIADRKKAAFKTKVVTITNKDPRDNGFTTTAHLSFENQHFGLAKNVPLDVPVELEVSLINIAKATRMTLHKDEIVDGKRTGNKRAISTNKYVVSYSEAQPE